MAIHPYNMLKEFSERLGKGTEEDKRRECKMIAHAIMYSRPADIDGIFEGLDIYDLASNFMADTCKRFVDSLIPRYEQIWELLGKPKCWEEWYAARLALKTTRKGKFNKLFRSPADKWDFMTEAEKCNYHSVHSDDPSLRL